MALEIISQEIISESNKDWLKKFGKPRIEGFKYRETKTNNESMLDIPPNKETGRVWKLNKKANMEMKRLLENRELEVKNGIA